MTIACSSSVTVVSCAQAAEGRVVQEGAVADQGRDLPFRLPELDAERKTQPLSETALTGEQALRIVPYEVLAQEAGVRGDFVDIDRILGHHRVERSA